MADIFACADLLISRAGATVLFEILALNKPALLIPLSKAASRGDQILNANSFKKSGYSDVLLEENLSKNSLIDSVNNTYKNRHTYTKAMQGNKMQNAIEMIVDIIEEVSKTQ